MKRNIDQRQAQKLRYVKYDIHPCELDTFPDFLIVGPQRTGTSWLYACLSIHPQILMSRPKEPKYFAQLKPQNPDYFVSTSLKWYLSCFQDKPKTYAKKFCRSLWLHQRLYRPNSYGDASAGYVGIDDDIIDEILILNPNIKAIIMVRNPIERVWSHAKKGLAVEKGKHITEVDDHTIQEFFRYPYLLKCSRYSENIPRWKKKLGNNLLVGMFDQIITDPMGLLGEICDFVEVDNAKSILRSCNRGIVNPSQREPLPDKFKEALYGLYGDEIGFLNREFGCSFK